MIPLFLLAFLSLNLSITASDQKGSEVVIGLNLEKYAGRWYEIASFPSPFVPRGSVNTRATYTLNTNGTVHVLNEAWSNGKRFSVEGILYKADPNSDEAKFKLQFFGIPVVGDYWVLYIDRNYQYVLIGNPEKKYLWVCYSFLFSPHHIVLTLLCFFRYCFHFFFFRFISEYIVFLSAIQWWCLFTDIGQANPRGWWDLQTACSKGCG